MNNYYNSFSKLKISTEEDMWLNKILILYKITDDNTAIEILKSGISYTTEYLDILTKERLRSIIRNIDYNQNIVVAAIPDFLEKYIYDISDDYFDEYKSQFDYEEDEDYLLDEIGGSYIMRKDYNDNKIMNFIPSTLVYGIISIDEKDKPVIYKNQNYFDYLSDEDKLYYCDVIDKAVNQDIDYEEYLSLVCDHKKSPNEKNFVLTKKH